MGDFKEFANGFMDILHMHYMQANCSIKYSNHMKTGSLINGSWDGAIGNLTRGVRVDCHCIQVIDVLFLNFKL